MSSLEKLIPDLDALLPELEEVYKDLHRHPELSVSPALSACCATVKARW
jgi:metal-dependent amidase/aminoacylase/carboxypeptidase family protein